MQPVLPEPLSASLAYGGVAAAQASRCVYDPGHFSSRGSAMHRLIALLTVLATGLLGACGPQPSEASAQERVAQAATATQDAGSAKMAMEMTMTGGAQEVT